MNKTTPSKPPTQPPSDQPQQKISFTPARKSAGHRAVIYGPGGIGKTTICALAPGDVACADADESLPILSPQLEAQSIPVPVLVPVHNWTSLRSIVKMDWSQSKIKTFFLDSITKIEEWAVAHTLATVKKEGGGAANRIEDYGYGKGYQHVFDTFLPLLADLDRLCRQGINVILVAHECVTNVPNPQGEDWIRYEPRLQNPASGKASIRLRVKEWADHVLFVGYDVAVEGGVGKGSGTRTLYPSELPHCMAKSRTCQDQVVIEQGVSPWGHFFK